MFLLQESLETQLMTPGCYTVVVFARWEVRYETIGGCGDDGSKILGGSKTVFFLTLDSSGVKDLPYILFAIFITSVYLLGISQNRFIWNIHI